MHLGKLEATVVTGKSHLLAEPTAHMIRALENSDISVAEINPQFSDTAEFCTHYEIPLERAANCVVVEASRADKTWLAACLVPATTRADINGAIRRHLGARRVSFAPMEKAVAETKMEYGGITPVGLPDDWPLLIDTKVAASDWIIVGSGIRGSKLILSGKTLAALPHATVFEITK